MPNLSLKIEGPSRTLFETGGIDLTGQEVKLLKAKKALLVADPQITDLDFFQKALDSLNKNDIDVTVFSDLQPEPAPEEADSAAKLARENNIQAVIGIGGGSAMDVAKAAAGLAGNDGKAEDYIGVELLPKRGLPKIIIPTTSGTGSEVTWTSVFTMREDKRKGGINSPYLYPETVILDPSLTYDLPPAVTAFTGIDALTHAIEAFVSNRSNPVSDMFALEGIRFISRHIVAAVEDGAKSPQAREGMLLGSHLAGKALAGAGVGACHGMAYPLGAFYGIGHGTANAVLLAGIMRFNEQSKPEKFEAISEALGLKKGQQAADFVASLCRDCGIPEGISKLGIPESALDEMSTAAMNVKLCMDNNPRQITLEDVRRIYKEAF